MIKLAIIAILVFVLNIPFGYWRANVKRFSSQWFLAIHIPVPFIVALRIFSGIGFAWYTYVFLVGAFLPGTKIRSCFNEMDSQAMQTGILMYRDGSDSMF